MDESDMQAKLNSSRIRIADAASQGQAAVLENLAAACSGLFECEAASVFYVDEGARKLSVCCASGRCAGVLKNLTFSYAGVAGWVAEHRSSIIVNNAQADRRFFNGVDGATGFTTLAIMACPISGGGRLAAVLELLNPGKGSFSDQDKAHVEALCAAAAAVI